MRPCLGQRKILTHAATTMSLNRAIEHPQRHPGRGDFDLRDFGARRLVANGVHQVGGAKRQQARLIDLDPRFRDVRADGALLGKRSAECDAPLDPRTHQLQRALGDTNHAHAVMNAPGPETPLRNLETTSLTEQQIRYRNTHILE